MTRRVLLAVVLPLALAGCGAARRDDPALNTAAADELEMLAGENMSDQAKR